jgi:para-nitrobenzyl esterase
MNRLCILLGAAFVVALGTGAASAAAPVTEVVVTGTGPLRGFAADGLREFLGIPYAAPPVGGRRWQPPESPPPWSTTRDALRFGPTCAQTSTLGNFSAPSASEDCLYLNVFAPTGNVHRLPVMVWIHGGGLFAGESDDYDPRALVERGRVIVVTFNYRLNVFGFLAHPALDAEGHPFGNYGLMDQQFALGWVRRNIAAFGGDPERITIFGESAGGQSVMAHLAAPSSRGLFQRAIIESGAYAITGASVDRAAAEATGLRFATAVGCPDAGSECLRALTVAQIQAKGTAFAAGTPLIIDGQVLPSAIGTAIESGDFNRVPVMNGTTRDEATFFVSLIESASGHALAAADYPAQLEAAYGKTNLPAVLAEYPLSAFPDPSLALAATQTDWGLACTALQADHWLARQVPTYAFEFADRTAPSPWAQTSFPFQAAHTFEIPYLFPGWHGARGTVPVFTHAQQRLSEVMIRYWTRFAATGNPNLVGLPVWPRFGTKPADVESLTLPRPVPSSRFAAVHHCAFWSGRTRTN